MNRWITTPAVLWLIVIVLSPVDRAYAQTYYREDHQYFKTMIADIRRPQNHTRLYRSKPVEFTNSKTKDGQIINLNSNHTFWDVAFGENFPVFGFNYRFKTDSTSFKRRGMDFFLEPNAHMLLDFGAQSNAVINADYRVGLGFEGRGMPVPKNFSTLYKSFVKVSGDNWSWIKGNFSWRIRGFHESTHLGDEFVLDAVAVDSLLNTTEVEYVEGREDTVKNTNTAPPRMIPFQRYNVSYEAIDLYLAWDPWDPYSNDRYIRLYGGGRWLDDGSYPIALKYQTSVNRDSIKADSLNRPLHSGTWEYQVGAEHLDKLKRGADVKAWVSPNWYIKTLSDFLNSIPVISFVMPKIENAHYSVIAIDEYYRYKYKKYNEGTPKRALGSNIIVGLIWGDYFRASKGISTVGVFLNYYRGPNPHGQFRGEDLHYIGLDFNIGL